MPILVGDCRETLKTIPDGSANCCVTSPPYWGLRDYGTAKWEGGDDPECDHTIESKHQKQGKTSARAGRSNSESQRNDNFSAVCDRCGATRVDDQIGLEASPELYVERLVAVFREVRRVPRDDATIWLNLGDSYIGGGGFSPDAPSSSTSKSGQYGNQGALRTVGIKPNGALKTKDLVGIPWRVAFALQADGWYLRQDIIWHKPNPMPESVTDRCTKAHEYIFLLAKSQKYYYDADAISEPFTSSICETRERGTEPSQKRALGQAQQAGAYSKTGRRNRRTVWSISLEPCKSAHFAVFPTKLIRPCILAGCPAGGTVLDPFFGAGTTGVVCTELSREYIGCELNPKYAAIAKRRIAQTTPDMFTAEEAASVDTTDDPTLFNEQDNDEDIF
jgi:DNA modification methylase